MREHWKTCPDRKQVDNWFFDGLQPIGAAAPTQCSSSSSSSLAAAAAAGSAAAAAAGSATAVGSAAAAPSPARPPSPALHYDRPDLPVIYQGPYQPSSKRKVVTEPGVIKLGMFVVLAAPENETDPTFYVGKVINIEGKTFQVHWWQAINDDYKNAKYEPCFMRRGDRRKGPKVEWTDTYDTDTIVLASFLQLNQNGTIPKAVLKQLAQDPRARVTLPPRKPRAPNKRSKAKKP